MFGPESMPASYLPRFTPFVITRISPIKSMTRFLPWSIAMAISALRVGAAEPAAVSAVPPAAANLAVASAPITLAELEARPRTATSEPDYWAAGLQLTRQALQLIESNTLTTADEFSRVSTFVSASDNSFRTDRVRYELRLSAAALGHAEAAKQLAAEWDRLLAALGRPLRTDFTGLRQKQPVFFQSDPAPVCVQTVLRDPEKARVAAKTAERNNEVKSIVDADQADRRRDWGKLSPDEMKALNARDHARNDRMREIVAAGELHTAADFANAALVMQHSAHFSGYQTAHELAVCAMLLGDRGLGRWLIAATYDRMLGSVGHDQRFGTQYSGMGGASVLVHVDPAGICDAERKALGCPTLEQARNRNVTAANDAQDAKLVAEFTGPNRAIRDPKFGLTATYPEGWKVREVKRWGDQQNTLFFEITEAPEPSPSLYYKVYRTPRPMTPEALVAFVRDEVQKKQASRRESWPDYTNRADSFRTYTLGAYPAFSWQADFTASNGDKWSEYFVRLQTDAADASFFLQAPAGQMEMLRPAVDQLMAGLRMPALQD